MLRSISITNKILLSLSILICGYSLTIGYGLFMGLENNDRLKELSKTTFPASQLSQKALSMFEYQINTYQHMIASGDLQLMSEAQVSAASLVKDLESMGKITLDAQLKKNIAHTRQNYQAFNATAQIVYAEMRRSSTEYNPAIVEKATKLASQRTEIHNDLKRYQGYFSSKLNDELRAVGVSIWQQGAIGILIFVLGVGISLVIIIVIVMRFIRTPLQKTITAFNTGAMGDFSMRLEETSKDEFGRLAHFFNTFMEKLELYNRDLHAEILGHQRSEEALRKSEELYTRLVDTIPDFIVQTALDGMILFVNDSTLEISGYTREELVGGNMLMFIAPEDKDRAIRNNLIMLERRLGSQEYSLIMKDGRKINFEVNGDILHNEDGTPFGSVLLCRDITQRKRAEEEKAKLESQNQQIQKAESLTRMAGAVAHHFNNQLAAVMGNLELAMTHLPRGEKPVESLNAAMQAAGKAAEVSALMLSYLGQTPGRFEPLDLSETCRLCLPMLQAVIQKDLVLEADLPSPGPTVNANENQIRQVLTNLVSNAKEAIGEGGGSIKLRVKTVSPAEISEAHLFPIGWKPQDIAYTCLEVTDAGSGISDKDIEKLFDPFFSSKFTGRGLGLPVVLGIVRAHHGAVNVESESGRGSTFRVFLPVSDEEVLRHPDKVINAPEIEEGGIILLVEDDELVRNMTAMMLTHLGFMVIEAHDGVEAVKVFRQSKDEISCALCDLTMPRMGGWETLAAMRKLKPDIPVILASGYDEVKALAGDHPEQPQAFLGKPYNLETLKEAICKALANR